ncbi:DUF7490 domain-containing protein [[Eubacterium] cellulosolvens]
MVKGKVKRKSRKVKNSRNRILYLIAALVGAIFIFTAGTMAITVSNEIEVGEPPERVEEAHLMVEEVFFIKEDSVSRTDDDSEEFVDILTTTYITNDGLGDAEDVEIHAYPRKGAYNLASCKTKTPVGEIPAQKTAEIEFVVQVPAGDKHEVELLILEDGKLILSGSGSVAISGSHSSAEKYKTHTVSGTRNDTDYDGMPDAWESFYGLNPSDPEDALKDTDSDGLTNLEEFRQNTSPCPAKKEDGDGGLLGDGDGDANSVAFGSLIVVVIVIIIIIIIITITGAVTKLQLKKENQLKKPDNSSHTLSKQQITTGSYQTQPYQTGYWRCPRCGGWLNNGVCMSCGGRYSLTPVQPAKMDNSSAADDESKSQ